MVTNVTKNGNQAACSPDDPSLNIFEFSQTSQSNESGEEEPFRLRVLFFS